MAGILVSPAAVSASAGVDAVAAEELGAATVGAAPVISTVLPPGLDSTSLMVSQLAIQRAAMTLQTLGQFTGERAFYAAAKDLSARSFGAIEAANAAAARTAATENGVAAMAQTEAFGVSPVGAASASLAWSQPVATRSADS